MDNIFTTKTLDEWYTNKRVTLEKLEGGVSHGKKEKGRQEDEKDCKAQSRKEDREEAPLV